MRPSITTLFRPVLFAFAFLTGVQGFTQNFDGFNYQAVIRNGAGDPLPDQAIGVQFTITSGVLDPHVETYLVTSDAQGMIELAMGEGQLQSGPAFSAIDWSSSTAWTYCVAVDITGGTDYQLLGCEAFKAVPFAMHARTSRGWKLLETDLISTNAGYVGIGTEAPTGPFEVRKADGSFVMRDWSGGGADVIVTDIVGRNSFMPQQRFSSEDSPNWVDIGLSTGQAYVVETNDAPRLSILQDGNVGIGTTTPGAKLDVAGTFKLTDGSQQDGKVLTSDPDGNASWKSVSAEAILGIGNVPPGDVTCISSSGTIGTGTFPRAIALAGNHAYVLNNFSNSMRIFNISDPAAPSISATIGTGTNPIAIAVAGSYAYVVGLTNDMRVYNISNPAAPSLSATVPAGSNPFSVAVSDGFAYVVNNGSNDLMVYDLGNPAAPSLIATIATGTGPFSVAASGGHAYVVNNGSNSLMVFNVSNPAAPSLSATIATATGPYSISVAGGHAYVVNFGSNSMMVFNVGDPAAPTLSATIATGSQPASVAAVGNYACVTNSGTSSNNMMVFNISDPAAPGLSATIATGSTPLAVAAMGSNAYVVNFGSNTLQVFDLFCPPLAIAVDPATGGLIAATVGSNEWVSSGTAIYNGNTGNVGIGNPAPGSLLHVGSTSGAVATPTAITMDNSYLFGGAFDKLKLYLFKSPTESYGLGLGSSGDLQYWAGTTTTGIHRFFTAQQERMRIAANGNVAIGSNNPHDRLHVQGGLRVCNNTFGPNGFVFEQNAFGHLDITYKTPTDVYANLMTMQFTGNVGIGTSTPQSKLAVNGKITCKEVEVTLAGFPDYVFEKDYRLMPLNEVERYIAAYGHLPNVPSACEVEENGLGLGEMNKILLEKVEELTLHAIAKEKEVAALKREMAERITRLEAMVGGSK